MSDKSWNRLAPMDQFIRKLKPGIGPVVPDVKLTIELIHGFEKFNTRPYHNYETWSDGYRISDGETAVEREDLDDALLAFREATNKDVE